MNRKPGGNIRPPFPADLLGLSEDEFIDIMREGRYSEQAIEDELILFRKLHYIYRPKQKLNINAVPVNDEEDKAYKALKRSQEKHSSESNTNNKPTNT